MAVRAGVTYLPLSLFSDLTVDATKGSKYKYIEGKGMKIAQSRQTVLPEIADKKVNIFSLTVLQKNWYHSSLFING
ncbi:hypothetical protein CSW98_12385 [Vibrio sp. HA2012]|uniref:UTRA domain-containing protein n=1 Tax=Vibrio sp. HA2012 TaxID=1971595 RepID=UPI000C2BA4B3|nr:UTRA domain-containing protein [Vibrio sp. HA2012]PJC85849.1 hypothetical protein CSW98_12385 [Vibrio sp. HA2012]